MIPDTTHDPLAPTADGYPNLHPAAVRPGDVVRDPSGAWWKVVHRAEAEATTREGTHLADMGDDQYARLDAIAAVDGFPITDHPGWVRADLDAHRARADFEEAQRRLDRALLRSLEEQNSRTLAWERGGEDDRH